MKPLTSILAKLAFLAIAAVYFLALLVGGLLFAAIWPREAFRLVKEL